MKKIDKIHYPESTNNEIADTVNELVTTVNTLQDKVEELEKEVQRLKKYPDPQEKNPYDLGDRWTGKKITKKSAY